jgi:hypothetical protein
MFQQHKKKDLERPTMQFYRLQMIIRDGQLMLIIPWLYHGYSLLWHDVKWCMGRLMLGFATTQTVRCSPCHGYSSRRAQQLLQVIHFLFIQKNLGWCVSINGGMWRWGPINILLLVVEPGYISNMFRNLWTKHGRQPTHRGKFFGDTTCGTHLRNNVVMDQPLTPGCSVPQLGITE